MSSGSYETEWDGIKMVVDYDYQPAERATLEEPGCDECITINSIEVGKVNILPVMCNDVVEAIECKLLNHIKGLAEESQEYRFGRY